MRKLFLFFLVLSINNLLLSQWNKIPELSSKEIYTVCFEGNSIYAGSDSVIFISTDMGSSWRFSAILDYKSSAVTDLIKADNVIFAATYGDGVFKSEDNGTSWQQVNKGLGSWGKYATHFFLSGDRLYLGTDGGGVYFMNPKDSLVWQEYNQGLPSNYASTIKALCTSRNSLIAAAGASGFYYIRPFQSPEWIEKTIHPIKAPNVNALVSFGDTIFAGTTKGVYRSYDGGYSWDSAGISAMPIWVTHLAKYNSRIYAGYNRENDFFIWYSDDMGSTWNILDHQFAYLYNFYIHNNRIWAAAGGGLLFNNLEPTAVPPVESIFNFSLKQNYPNPFNPTTSISFSLKDESHTKLIVYDLLGRVVAVLVDERLGKGAHSATFDASSLPSGVYLYQLSAGSNIETRKMMFLK